MAELPCWVEGRVVPRAQARVSAVDSAVVGGLGHYTTARVRGGEVLWIERHLGRLKEDASRLGLPPVDEGIVRAAFAALAPAAFDNGDGAIRLQHSAGADGRSQWLGVPRGLGDEPAAWSVIRSPIPHDGPRPWSGIKTTNTLAYTLAREAAHTAGAQDALFVDASGLVIEGGRTNLFAVLDDGSWVTPDLARGGVSGTARAVVLESTDAFSVRNVPFHRLTSAREIVLVNALRGGRAVVSLDGHPVGSASGPALALIDRLLDLH